MSSAGDSTIYGGFWRRLGAMLIDVLVFATVLPLVIWAQHKYRLYDVYAIAPWLAASIVYWVWLVARFGGTPGKLAMRLRIRRLDGAPVGFGRALLRHAPELVLWLLTAIALALPLLSLSDSQYRNLASSLKHRREALVAAAPAWYLPIEYTYRAWVYGEVLILLTNRKRRALHDFLARTVVVRIPRDVGP